MGLKKKEKGLSWIKWIPLLLIFTLLILAYLYDAHHYLSFQTLKAKHRFLKSYVQLHPAAAPVIFVGVFIAAVAISLPVTDILGVIGGFLFPFPLNMLYIVLGATGGACLIFLATKTAIQDVIKKKTKGFSEKLEIGFRKWGWSYLLFLRFIPIFPFWLVNLVAAFFGIQFLTFLWTTALGILPLSYIHAEIGQGLQEFLDKGNHFSIHNFFNLKMRIALILLGVISLLPLLLKKYLEKRER